MPRINTQKEAFDNMWLPRHYEDRELADFDKKYRSHNFKSTVDFLKYVRALSPIGAVYINMKRDGVVAYEYWNNLLRQWDDYLSRKNYAIKQQSLSVGTISESELEKELGLENW